ncbi:basic secretory protein-like protein [Aquimarina longa]|uniref:basic secretory protein-like protein n=1 Tax=Aquimarina longa TaxID=1080221 RepID=UPI0007856A8B|nr:basic secretory protein-like protein [Aquimarina longa]
MKHKKRRKLFISLCVTVFTFFIHTKSIAQTSWDDFNYPKVTVIDLGTGTNTNADAILNAIGRTQSERTRFYNARILSVVKRLYKTPQEVPNFTELELVFSPNYCGGIAAKSGTPPKIRIENSTHYLNMVLNQSIEELKAEIGGTLTHEVTHAYSHEPKNAGTYETGQNFFGFIEGIADFVRFKEGYSTLADIDIDQTHKWLKGYNGSAFFINWLNDNYTDFAYKFNKSAKTIDPWTFKAATEQIVPGKTIDQLWNEYVNSIENQRRNISLPTPNFTTSSTTVTVGEQVSFTNTSTNAIEYAWIYKGKSCVSFTNSKNFNITFDTPGTYKVTLEAKNFKGKNLKDISITVKPCEDKNNIAIGKTVTTSSSENAEFSASKATDNDTNTRWSSGFSNDQWIAVDLEKESNVCAIEISWFTCCSIMIGAKDYQVQTSNDGNNWSTIKNITNNFDNFNYIPLNTKSRYIRIKGIKRTATSFGYSINEFKIYGGEGTITPPDTSEDLTQPNGSIVESNNDSPNGEDISKLIDNDSFSKYLTFKASTTVTYTFDKAYVINKYSLTSGGDAPERDPKNWTLQGSNDGTTWTTIDTKSNNSFANRNEKKIFSFTNTKAFSKIRFNFNNTSGTIFQLSELEVFGKEGNTDTGGGDGPDTPPVITGKDFQFFPNPIISEVYVIPSESKISTINIRNLQGNVVFSKENVRLFNRTMTRVGINLPSGMYLLEIDGVTKKLVVSAR